jgi:hypothetical protein
MTRRAALALRQDGPERTRQILLAGCDAVDRCASAGANLHEDAEAIRIARDHQPVGAAREATVAFFYVADAARAAESALDFDAADEACTNSTMKAIGEIREAAALSTERVEELLLRELGRLRLACATAGISRNGGVTAAVLEQLTPIHQHSN